LVSSQKENLGNQVGGNPLKGISVECVHVLRFMSTYIDGTALPFNELTKSSRDTIHAHYQYVRTMAVLYLHKGKVDL